MKNNLFVNLEIQIKNESISWIWGSYLLKTAYRNSSLFSLEQDIGCIFLIILKNVVNHNNKKKKDFEKSFNLL